MSEQDILEIKEYLELLLELEKTSVMTYTGEGLRETE